jgi:hypothetical protein
MLIHGSKIPGLFVPEARVICGIGFGYINKTEANNVLFVTRANIKTVSVIAALGTNWQLPKVTHVAPGRGSTFAPKNGSEQADCPN